jgi:hypothetical protein
MNGPGMKYPTTLIIAALVCSTAVEAVSEGAARTGVEPVYQP